MLKDVTVIWLHAMNSLALRKLRRKNNGPQPQTAAPPIPGPEETRNVRIQTEYIRGMISGSPDSGSFPYVKKSAKFTQIGVSSFI